MTTRPQKVAEDTEHCKETNIQPMRRCLNSMQCSYIAEFKIQFNSQSVM